MLLSRVADALYWISRYLERAEHTARLARVRLDLGLDRRQESGAWDFERLYAGLRITPPAAMPANPSDLVDVIVFDAAKRDSVIACVTAARENARQVREEISSEMWEQLNALFLRLRQVRADNTLSGRPHYLLQLIIEGVHLFQGTTDATMGHGEGWQYLQVGRFLERASAIAALLDQHLKHPGGESGERAIRLDELEWVGLLRSCSALEAYCRHYTADLRPERIAEFLLLNHDFPRSVHFAASRVESALRTLGQLNSRAGRAERLAGRLHASLDYGQVDEVLSEPHAYLESIGRYCDQIHSAVYQTYIGYPIESALPA
jgi:uncharacterized alpha-E superfamily protein